MTITVDEDELLKLINQINQMKNEMTNTQEDMANKHTEEMQDLKKQYDEQKEIRTEINDKLTTKLEENSRLMDDIHQKEIENIQLGSANTILESENTTLENQNSTLETNNEDLKTQNSDLDKEQGKLIEEQGKLKTKHFGLNIRNQTLNVRKDGLDNKLKEKNDAINLGNELIKFQDDEIASLEKSISQTNNENKIMKYNLKKFLPDSGDYYKVSIIRNEMNMEKKDYAIERTRYHLEKNGMDNSADYIVNEFEEKYGGTWHVDIMLKKSYSYQGWWDNYFIAFTMGEFLIIIKQI